MTAKNEKRAKNGRHHDPFFIQFSQVRVRPERAGGREVVVLRLGQGRGSAEIRPGGGSAATFFNLGTSAAADSLPAPSCRLGSQLPGSGPQG